MTNKIVDHWLRCDVIYQKLLVFWDLRNARIEKIRPLWTPEVLKAIGKFETQLPEKQAQYDFVTNMTDDHENEVLKEVEREFRKVNDIGILEAKVKLQVMKEERDKPKEQLKAEIEKQKALAKKIKKSKKDLDQTKAQKWGSRVGASSPEPKKKKKKLTPLQLS